MVFVKRTLPVLLGIFLVSVLVRLPQLQRPLGGNHEFCTAVALRIMQVWHDGGIVRYGFNPAMNYMHDADKYINNHASQTGLPIDDNGNYYYVSHPPLAYYFPFFVFKALGVRPDVIPLRIFNLLLHFVSALFVYFTVCLLSFNRARSLPYRSALVAYAVYLFLPVTLWFQGNVYMSDMAVHTLFIIGVYIILKMTIRQKFHSPKYLFFYALVLFLMLYTSWLGVFYAAGVLLYAISHVKQVSGFRAVIAITVVCLIVSFQIMIYQYSQVNGPLSYFSEMISRYMARGSFADTKHGLLHFMFGYLWFAKTLLYNYLMYYNIFFLLAGLFVYFALTRSKLRIVFSENGYRFIWFSVAPVLMLHLFLLNYSAHSFTVLYASLFFSVLAGMMYDKIKKSGSIPLARMQAGLVVVLLLFVVQYHWMNTEKAVYKQAGETISKNVTAQQVIFTNQPMLLEPQTILYAQRNIRFASNTADALEFLNKYGRKEGVFIRLQMHTDTVYVQEKHIVRAGEE
ncbi:MAG: glycosyltransferase family 39 protein [Chitinophagales bacterium]|nr:glycosyltransferase family 39 protein [Chitinophagales bacterium]MDW8418041.1 hypothetical protein [Chitinophagales bacterium]